MMITLIAAIMIMAGYFLLLYGAVGFIQDKRFFLLHLKRIWPRFLKEKRDFAASI